MTRFRSAFTLVELLVVLGIVVLLIAILLPSLSRARASARVTQCAANLHQLELAFSTYAADNRGWFPPNLSSPAPGIFWSDDSRIGHYIPSRRPPVAADKAGGGVYICPEDSAPSYLCYSMNIWASSAIDPTVSALSPAAGVAWTAHSGRSAQLILLAESYSVLGSSSLGWYAEPTIGAAGANASLRFGGGSGIAPPVNANRWGYLNCELNFMRHRTPGSAGTGTQPIGRTNIGFADGHVATLTNSDLVNGAGNATGLANWSPADWKGQ
jgi:prepilin-type processing-associated H-X9-DG protein